jgi:hypothetical protein
LVRFGTTGKKGREFQELAKNAANGPKVDRRTVDERWVGPVWRSTDSKQELWGAVPFWSGFWIFSYSGKF